MLTEQFGLLRENFSRQDTKGIRGLGKVEKVYLHNTNWIYQLSAQSGNEGNIRETFFIHQMQVRHKVRSSQSADFVVGAYTFEIGGKDKKQQQITSEKNAFVIKDNIVHGNLIILPLWAFGLTYCLMHACMAFLARNGLQHLARPQTVYIFSPLFPFLKPILGRVSFRPSPEKETQRLHYETEVHALPFQRACHSVHSYSRTHHFLAPCLKCRKNH